MIRTIKLSSFFQSDSRGVLGVGFGGVGKTVVAGWGAEGCGMKKRAAGIRGGSWVAREVLPEVDGYGG